MSRAAILVLGMHRSGTSALTWLLGQLGAALPADGIAASAANARGYHESAGLVAADDQLLRVCRSSWFDPRPLDLACVAGTARQDRIADAIRAAWGDAPLLAVKDPRQCRFVPVVVAALAGLGIEARAVLMLRPAAEVAASLAARDGTSAAYAHLLWLRHMIDAERATRALPRAILSYDRLLGDWRDAVARLAPLTGEAQVADEAAVDAFLDRGLRHHEAGPAALDQPLAGIVAATEAGLARLLDADDAAARAALDEAYALLAATPRLEGDIVHDELRHRRMPVAPDEPEAESSAPPEPPAEAPPPPPPPGPDPTGDAAAIRASGLFDGAWYVATYPDAAASGLDPIEHYVQVGAPLGYNPGPLFDTGYYARQMARRMAGRGAEA